MADKIKSGGGDFERLTEKQAAVLSLLARGLTSKEIAAKLKSSVSAVDRHIEILRSRFGGITRLQLARLYRERPGDFRVADETGKPCIDSTKERFDLVEPQVDAEQMPQDETEADIAFRDPIALRIDAPWSKSEEPRIVPRVLDGDNATLTRGMTIAIMLFAIIASLILGLAAAQAIADAVN